MIETAEQLEGRRLGPGEVFRFACHDGLACFNTCCAGKRLPLFPYDLLRLRRGLGQSSGEVLGSLVELEEDPVSGWPVLRLRLTPEGRCPLVGSQGCRVYEHRPAACRTYPLARAVTLKDDGRPAAPVFLLQEAPGCLGCQEQRTVDLEQWVEEQGLQPYQEANDRLLGLVMHPRRRGKLHLTTQQTHAVILALYNLDVFRQMAAAQGFSRRFGLAPARVAQALQSDEGLLGLGQEWLTAQLFGPPASAPGRKKAKTKGRGR